MYRLCVFFEELLFAKATVGFKCPGRQKAGLDGTKRDGKPSAAAAARALFFQIDATRCSPFQLQTINSNCPKNAFSTHAHSSPLRPLPLKHASSRRNSWTSACQRPSIRTGEAPWRERSWGRHPIWPQRWRTSTAAKASRTVPRWTAGAWGRCCT